MEEQDYIKLLDVLRVYDNKCRYRDEANAIEFLAGVSGFSDKEVKDALGILKKEGRIKINHDHGRYMINFKTFDGPKPEKKAGRPKKVISKED